MRCFRNVATLVRAWGHQKSSLGNQLGFPSSGDGSYILVARRVFFLLLVLSVGASAFACKVPVFRYALERWAVDKYRLVAIVNEASEATTQTLSQLEAMKQAGANIETDVVDLSKLTEEELWQLEDFDGSADTPRLQVFYPEKDGRRLKCWEGNLNKDSVSQWTDSPLRQQLIRDLVGGDSAIFLMIDGAEKSQNEEIAGRVRDSLAIASEEIAVPEGVIPRDQAAEYLQKHPEATMDDVLRSDIPLRVAFRLRRLSPNDEQESALLAMIYGLVEPSDQPLLVPIFGRGRMLDALDAADCDHDVIMNACRYMVGECSCTVKALNPGVDLVLTTNWSEHLGQSVVMVAPAPPGPPQLITIPDGGDGVDPEATAESESLPVLKLGLIVACIVLLATGLRLAARLKMLG